MLFRLLSGSAAPAQSGAGDAPPKQPVGGILLVRAEPARYEHRGAHGKAERERVDHEANHRGVGERGEPPLPDERPHDEHVHDLVGGLKQVCPELRQREAREVGSRAATQEVYFPHWVFLCTIETKRTAAAKPRPLGSKRAHATKHPKSAGRHRAQVVPSAPRDFLPNITGSGSDLELTNLEVQGKPFLPIFLGEFYPLRVPSATKA